MVTPVFNPLFFAKSGSDEYQIERSLRFNSADSAYLDRTLSSGTTTTWTFSTWLKRGLISGPDGDGRCFFGRGSAQLCFTGGDLIRLNDNSGSIDWRTTAVFRDPTAWYHIVVVWDSNNGTAGDRLRLYINGTLNTSWSLQSGTVSLGSSYGINEAAVHNIGRNVAVAGRYTDGYMTEINFIDGQALTPSSFGETNADTGAWDPKTYSGSYGTNGFYLNFSDNSNTTAATLGKDYSGNGNNWTPNNFSVTAGAGNDSMTDTPTNYGTGTDTGGVLRGNYCTLNPLDRDNGGSYALTNGNLQVTSDTTRAGRSTFAVNSGKWYWEVEFTGLTSNSDMVGILSSAQAYSVGNTAGFYSGGYCYLQWNGNKQNNNTQAAYGASYTNGDVIGIALDMDNGKVFFAKNNVWQASGDPVAGTNAAYTGLSGLFSPVASPSVGSVHIFNFGQRAFAYTPPTGFLSLCTQNIAEGSITTSGTFTGNANADGPVVALNGIPTTMTINSNAVTFGTHADKLAEGFKLRTSSASYNTSGSNSYSVSATSSKFKYARAQANP